jgi:hypothetical protein
MTPEIAAEVAKHVEHPCEYTRLAP